MNRKMDVGYPLWLALIIYWLLTFALLSAALVKTHGHFGYPLDDTYIHMAIARHFVIDGFWGISQNGFSSSSSSPLWTLLIALVYRTLGVNDWAPFVLCLSGGSLIIFNCYYLFRNRSNPLRLTAYLLLIVLFTPLPLLTLTGMEHIIHGLFTVWLVYSAATFLSTSESDNRRLILLLLLSGLVPIIRYEGLFLVSSIVFLFLINKRFFQAFLIALAGLLPVTIYGIFSLTHGWYFFPNSILLKGNTPVPTLEGMAGFLQHLPVNLIEAPHILVLMIASLGVYLWCDGQGVSGKRERCLITIFALMTLLHMQFAGVGWFYRYEAYLVLTASVILMDMACLLIIDAPVKVDNVFNSIVIISLGILLTMPLAWRAAKSLKEYPIAVTNIYEQQYQMGLFLKKYYPGKAVAANDIGAINYLADVKILDLYGLGSMEVLRARRNGSYDKDVVGELVFTRDVEIVVIYTSWFEGKIPSEWVEIGRWKIADNVVCDDDEVSFYVPGASWVNQGTTALRGFSDLLPSTVEQSGIYIDP